MLELRNINKSYKVGEELIPVLKDVNLQFTRSEFVSILGSSGSGKTTLLNIIGGLDQYSDGDLIIDGTSTKMFKERDWDSYRNTTIGFIFQNYNLISHLSVLDNITVALSLSGKSAAQRTKLAKEALIQVGLEKHMHKKPNQLSGGQMQRVAIARALVNNPEILLADEPTGALDSKTSIQIMDIIKKISKDRLVIMVTHNPDLAEQYSDRIIKVSDGQIVSDVKKITDMTITTTNLYHQPANHDNEIDELKDVCCASENELADKKNKKFKKKNKVSMSFITALKSSAKNLMTKKARTMLTAFAGSIGIISIALVLGISSGMNSYISSLEKDTLAGFPITISSASETSYNHLEKLTKDLQNSDDDDNVAADVFKVEKAEELHRNLYEQDVLGDGSFIDYLNDHASNYVSSIGYPSGYEVKAVIQNEDGTFQKVEDQTQNQSHFHTTSVLSELPQYTENLKNQFNVVASENQEFIYADQPDQLVLIVDCNNTLSQNTIKALGLDPNKEIKYEDLLGKEFSIIYNDNYYMQNTETFFTVNTIDQDMYNSGYKARITAVLKMVDAEETSSLPTGLAYTHELTDYMCDIEKDSKIVTAQENNQHRNIRSINSTEIDDISYQTLLQQLGANNDPSSISIYPSTFENKDKIIDVINDYNNLIIQKYGANTEETKKYSIVYTDMAATIASTMTTMIHSITMILTAFAAISLIVSSIMIGIITYVSVVERTKEIGIMRAIGARKKDISRIFNAETVIIGISSGTFGVLLAIVLMIPINGAIEKFADISGFTANLPVFSGLFLILLSIILTFVAGLIPSGIAARKRPVDALRTE